MCKEICKRRLYRALQRLLQSCATDFFKYTEAVGLLTAFFEYFKRNFMKSIEKLEKIRYNRNKN